MVAMRRSRPKPTKKPVITSGGGQAPQKMSLRQIARALGKVKRELKKLKTELTLLESLPHEQD